MKKIFCLLLSLIIVFNMCALVFADITTTTRLVTCNPSDKGSSVVLSNDNLTVSRSSTNYSYVRSNYRVEGKKYFEVKVTNIGYNVVIGISNINAKLESGGVYPNDSNEIFYISFTGNICKDDNTIIPQASPGKVDDVIMIAVDESNRKVYFGKNGAWINSDPSSNTNGVDIPFSGDIYAWMGGYKTNDIVTANFGATPFQYSVPEGYLPYNASNIVNAPTNLVATAGDKKVNLSWSEVPGATYNVRRSGTAGGPYGDPINKTAITGTNYPDEGLDNGTIYYYVVTAVTSAGESVNSNEASATPKAGSTDPQPQPTGDRAILEISMTNNTVKEYDLSTAEVNAFLKWYEERANDSGKAYYAIPKNYNVKPFTSRTEYISFDKIYSFEVKAYKN